METTPGRFHALVLLLAVRLLRFCQTQKYRGEKDCRRKEYDGRIVVDRVVAEGRELPEDMEYEYSPRTPVARNPPISREEFRGPLNSCDGPCRLSWLPFHDCFMPQNSGCLVMIPKKSKPMCPDELYAWGLRTRHSVSAIHVFLTHFWIFAITFGLWGWWQSGHPQDLQGAAVPVTLVLGFCSIFWGTVGILKITRDNDEYA
jgi:hypothetical protein